MRISSDEDDKGSFKKSDLVEVYYSAMSFPVNGDIKILPPAPAAPKTFLAASSLGMC